MKATRGTGDGDTQAYVDCRPTEHVLFYYMQNGKGEGKKIDETKERWVEATRATKMSEIATYTCACHVRVNPGNDRTHLWNNMVMMMVD